MLHKVQEWEVDNQTVFKPGEQVELVDSSGVVLRGTICGEASGDGKAGMAQVRLDFWQPGHGPSQPGCDSPHALGGHEDYMATQRLGRPACGKHLLVRVGAPMGHRIEEKAEPGAVRLTSRDASCYGVGGQDICPGTGVLPSTSRGAGLNLVQFEEKLLDYEEEEEVHEEAVQTGGTVEMPQVNKKAVESDRLVGRHHQELVGGNLHRGEDYGMEPIMVGGYKVGLDDSGKLSGKDMGIQTVVGHGNGSIDASIQVGIGSEVVSGSVLLQKQNGWENQTKRLWTWGGKGRNVFSVM
ncbi:hypothetical protein NDU88_000773 [Pleurodeles waltl]|uniref:Uncharacterized protein n=1 Tax=Pleurodeles waltl TaxID=8319 RepID=A0AAV7VUH3_PLEWA|nr:hypothetical protein NDU88_000773 [Pleurodeles waltl]